MSIIAFSCYTKGCTGSHASFSENAGEKHMLLVTHYPVL
jgi:hypothetical protein